MPSKKSRLSVPKEEFCISWFSSVNLQICCKIGFLGLGIQEFSSFNNLFFFVISDWVFVGNIYWKMPLTKLCRYPKRNWPNPSCIFALTAKKVWITEDLQENFSFFYQEKFSIHITVFLSILQTILTQFRWEKFHLMKVKKCKLLFSQKNTNFLFSWIS